MPLLRDIPHHRLSPYVAQHRDNPVAWYAWGPDAFALAQARDRPVFVSIGYASCHWCHVMAHESFEDPDTAADLARWFVAIKVDREERPDIDAVYMAAVQAMTGSGGWPMSVFCTPDGRPFFGGTYFPPTDRHGMPSFRRVLAALAEAWAERRHEVDEQADALVSAVAGEVTLLDRLAARTSAGAGTGHGNGNGDGDGDGDGDGRAEAGAGTSDLPPFGELLATVTGELAERFDPEWGGFGAAPKFPRPTLVELCLRQAGGAGDTRALAMATVTLDAMAAGGIYDHLAGGFARYATDAHWLVPHFEKMLTDQALLARAYLHAWQATGDPDYRQVLEETLDYVLSDLAAPGGGLYSSEDADAGGVEGGHATFTPAQVAAALAEAGRPELAAPALDWYGIDEAGNWEGTTILTRPPGATLGRPAEVEEARRILLAARRRRPQPATDTKVLTEWNAMATAVLAEAAGVTGRSDWAEAAEALGRFCFERLRRADGRWLRSAGTEVPGFAADYAWLVECCTRLGELTGRAVWTDRAAEVAGAMLDLFWDERQGGLFTTGRDAEQLVVRAKEVIDGAVPSANAVAAGALLRLAALTGDDRARDCGTRIVELAVPLLAEHPSAVADMVAAAAWVAGGTEVVVTGERPDLLAAVRARWLPDAVVAWGERRPSPLWEGRPDGQAWVCHRFACRAPAGDAGTLGSQLDDAGALGAPAPRRDD